MPTGIYIRIKGVNFFPEKQCFQKGHKINVGRKFSKKHNEKISKALKGRTPWNKDKKCPQISKALKGRTPWNKNTKGLIKPNSGSFKKGLIPWSKGKKLPSGKNAFHWKTGKTFNNGYILIYNSNHPFACRNYVFEHRLVAEKCLGRYLTKEERIHHINGKKRDNQVENLYLFPCEAEHKRFHCSKNKPQLTSNLIS